MAKASVKSQTLTLHMDISPISKLTMARSREVFIHGIPWEVQVCKEKNLLKVHLYCTKKHNSSVWTVPACFTIHLLKDEKTAITEHVSPYVFNPAKFAFGVELIQWDELLRYVRDDKIELKLEITVEDPNCSNRSVLQLETIDKSCDCGSLSITIFRLTLTKVKNLMAVHSPKFVLRGMPWDFTVYKYQLQSPTLGIMLEPKDSTKKNSFKMTMSVKLVSFENYKHSVETSTTDQVKWPENLDIDCITTWDELLKPDNGFVNNNSITLEVEIKASNTESRCSKNLKRPHSPSV